jgi:AcrR family transcriptional regulator
MPRATFVNLPQEKKKIIEETAIIEFASFGYDKASVNRIVEKCKIAKGSFYQYFD